MKEWQRDLLWFLAILFFIWFLYEVRSIVLLFFITGSLAYIINPTITKFAHKLRLKKGLAIGIFYIMIISPIIAILVLILPILGNQIMSLVRDIPKYYEVLTDSLRHLQDTVQTNPEMQRLLDSFLTSIQPRIENYLATIGVKAFNFIVTLTNSIFTLILAIVLNFYFLIDMENIEKWFMNILPENIKDKTLNALKEINVSFKSFLKAQAILCLFVGIADGLGAWMLGVNYALILGIIAGFTEIIPYLGPFLGAVPAIVIALTISPWKALEIAIWYLVVQQIEAHFVVPNVMGKTMGLHPLTVIFSLLVFGKLLGFWGVILAVPISAIIKIVLKIYLTDVWKKGGING
ncbi:AI-2E family transporter [bacterium]|nr:AI-2E family transporter [bacterium]